MKRNNYQTPKVLQEVSVRVEREFLKASLVDTAVVASVGHVCHRLKEVVELHHRRVLEPGTLR